MHISVAKGWVKSMQNIEFKRCCADFYQEKVSRLLFGNSMHPGGLKLTEKLGRRLELQRSNRVLDLACGVGTTGIFLAENFGCHVTGLDLAEENIKQAKKILSHSDVSDLVDFMVGDAECIDFEDRSFNCAVCECSFCLFPDKKKTSEEIHRVIKNGGKIGLSDIVVRGNIPQSLRDSLYRFVCLLEAESEDTYGDLLQSVGFADICIFDKKNYILQLLDDINKKMFAIELLNGLGKIKLGVDLEPTKKAIREVRECVNAGIISYALITGVK